MKTKKYLLVCLTVCFVAFLAAGPSADAAVVTFTTDQMATWGEVDQGQLVSVTNLDPIHGSGSGVDFVVDFTLASNYTDVGFNDINIGWSWDTSNGWHADYSGYDGFGLTLTNWGSTPVMANLFMNSGMAPTNPDQRYETPWEWLDPYDVSNPDTHGYNLYLSFADLGVQNLAEVTAIGIGMGLNGPSSTEEYKGTGGTLGANPVPVPGAVWLLGSGIMGLLGIGRRMARA